MSEYAFHTIKEMSIKIKNVLDLIKIEHKEVINPDVFHSVYFLLFHCEREIKRERKRKKERKRERTQVPATHSKML